MAQDDRKNKDEKEQEKEQFTGTPEQQFPDLEAEDKQDRQKEQYEDTAETGKKDSASNE